MTAAPKYVHVGWLVENLGLSAATWRHLAECRFVRAGKLRTRSAKYLFDREHCEEQLARVVAGELQLPRLPVDTFDARAAHRDFLAKRKAHL